MRAGCRFLIYAVISCVLLGSLPAVVQALFSRISPHNFWLSCLTGTVYASCIAIPCWLLMPAVQRFTKNRAMAAKLAAIAATLAFFAVAGCLAANLFFLAIGFIGPSQLWTTFRFSLRMCLLITFTGGALTTLILSLQGRLQSAREELQQRQINEERERKMAAEARFASLESRVRPHFLFNTLNSISALVREDPAEAERMIERLAELLRFSLDSELAGLVTLSEELRIVRDYLEIERVRFGARLRYTIDAAPETLPRSVPALSVQTLVENSVKYAVGASREGAAVQVSAALVNGALRVEVRDDGPGFDPSVARKPGHGLDLLERRLTALFGAGASLEINGAPGHASVVISIA